MLVILPLTVLSIGAILAFDQARRLFGFGPVGAHEIVVALAAGAGVLATLEGLKLAGVTLGKARRTVDV
jgi:hypothetical protein